MVTFLLNWKIRQLYKATFELQNDPKSTLGIFMSPEKPK
jgi:hypothetical protein